MWRAEPGDEGQVAGLGNPDTGTEGHHRGEGDVPNTETSPALTAAEAILAQRHAGPRLNRNMLVFGAAAEARLGELRTAARQHLAWNLGMSTGIGPTVLA